VLLKKGLLRYSWYFAFYKSLLLLASKLLQRTKIAFPICQRTFQFDDLMIAHRLLNYII
jgi:hypothetical protein